MRRTKTGALASLLVVATSSLLVATGCSDEAGSDCGPATGRVIRVIDGDTIELSGGERIRYLMVDTPEVSSPAECYGDVAKQFNTDMVLDRDVELTYDQQCTDKWGRLLAYVSVAGAEINTRLVERGYACVLHIPPNGDDRLDEFLSIQALAQSQGRGLWGACAVAPCGQ